MEPETEIDRAALDRLAPEAVDYLLQRTGEALKAETDQEESSVRVMPFFATALGFLVTFLGLAMPRLPSYGAQPSVMALYALTALLLLDLIAILVVLHGAVRPRRYRYPINEQDLIALAAGWQRYETEAAQRAGEADPPIGLRTREALRRETLAQTAQAAMNNRRINLLRLRARSRAFAALFFAIFLAVCILGLTLWRVAHEGGSDGRQAAASDGPGVATGR